MYTSKRLCLALAGFVGGVLLAHGAVTARYDFTDTGNGGTNLLAASVGTPAIVRETNGVPVVGLLGNVTAANGEGHADGLGAICIPRGQYLMVPHGLQQTTGARWFLRLRFKIPTARFSYSAILSFDENNKTDADLFLRMSDFKIGQSSFWGWSEQTVSFDTWHTLVLSCDGTQTKIYLNGTEALTSQAKARYSQYTDLTKFEHILIGADESGEDYPIVLDNLIIGSGEYPTHAVVDPDPPANKIYDTCEQTCDLASTDDYTVSGMTNATDRGFYPVTVSLRDKETTCWIDGTTADKQYWFCIRDAILFPELTAHFTFDDAGNAGLNLLKATVGSDAVVRAGSAPAANVAGIGYLTATNGEGHADGTGAVSIPKGQFLAFAHGLAPAAGTRWRAELRFTYPNDRAGWRSLFMLDATNNAQDAAVLINGYNRVGSGTYFNGSQAWDKLPTTAVADQWNTVAIACDGNVTTLFVNDTWDASDSWRTVRYAFEFANLSNIPAFGLSGDNNGEDNTIIYDDVKVWGEGPAVPVVPPAATNHPYTGAVQELLPATRTYSAKNHRFETAAGTYDVVVGLIDPDVSTWTDGSNTDRVVRVIVSEHENAWTAEPAIAATTWAADDVVPAFTTGASAYGTVDVWVDGVLNNTAALSVAGTHEITFRVPVSAEATALEKTIAVTVLAAGETPPVRITARAYVTNGITMFLDGIENAGFSRHDGAAAIWRDLSGNGYDWTVNSAYGTWTENGLQLHAADRRGAGEQVTAQSFARKITLLEFIWQTEEMIEGIIFASGSSAVYLFTDKETQSVSFAAGLGTPATAGVAAAYSVEYTRAETDDWPSQKLKTLRVNGVGLAAISTDGFTMNETPLIGNRSNYDMPAKGVLSTLRTYNRSLSDAERALNSAIDLARYGQGMALASATAPEGYRVENDTILVRVDCAAVLGKVACNGATAARTQTLWVPLGSTVTLEPTFRIPSGTGNAFVWTGLPAETVTADDGGKVSFAIQSPLVITATHPEARRNPTVILIR